MAIQTKLDPKKVEEINTLVKQLAPGFAQLIVMLRAADIHEFDMDVNAGDNLIWRDPQFTMPSPTQGQLLEELTAILNQHYPPLNGFSFMGMIWNPNRAVAETMAKIVADYRKRDRVQVEGQLLALLAAFKQGS